LNRVQSSRRLEREAQRNVELIWLTGRLAPDFKTIADFRKDNGPAIRRVCREFVLLCRNLNLFSDARVAIDGSKFKAANGRDRNFTKNKLKARMQQLEESIAMATGIRRGFRWDRQGLAMFANAYFFSVFSGGEGEIRTRDRVAPTPVFKTGAFNRSATSPF
jgi:hypothetical protein